MAQTYGLAEAPDYFASPYPLTLPLKHPYPEPHRPAVFALVNEKTSLQRRTLAPDRQLVINASEVKPEPATLASLPSRPCPSTNSASLLPPLVAQSTRMLTLSSLSVGD